MSLFTQQKTENLASIYIYIIVGVLGSLLIVFLVQKSLPLDKTSSQKYHQHIKDAQKQVIELEKTTWQALLSNFRSSYGLQIALNKTESILATLEETPSFIDSSDQKIIASQLEAGKILFNSQAKIIQDLEEVKEKLISSCQYAPRLRQKNQVNLLTKKTDVDNNLSTVTDNLLSNLVLQCYKTDNNLELTIKSQVKELKLLLKQEKFIPGYFEAIESLDYAQVILANQEKIEKINNELDLVKLHEKLRELESIYLNSLGQLEYQTNIYRFTVGLLLLIISITIAYKIINNLTKTNRKIVKVLEGFTQELETKVEQRTAQLEESIQNTEAALAQAQNANKAKSRFLANMSHELRTPLNAILGFTQLMCRDSSLAQEHQENIQIINRSGEHLLKLINDILEMSKIEVGQITLNENKFDFYIMLKSIEEMLKMKAEAKQLNLNFEIAQNIPQYIFTDEGKLRQILINLLGNALKFTEKGQINLTVELEDNHQLSGEHIDFLFSDTYALKFAVKDTGAGIATEEMDRLFSPFEQTQTGRISQEGSGLGLSICQKFVELMGGKLTVESEVGKGSIFSFAILIKSQYQNSHFSPEVNLLEQDEHRQIIALAPNQPEYRILAVDDVPASRLLLKKMLTGIGFIVEEAVNGQEAVQKWFSWKPDLILMDMRMPVMDGYEATKQIKSQSQARKTIIIALTASAFEEERVIILSAGCDDFLRKPFYEQELLATIGKYLDVEYIYQVTSNTENQEAIFTEQLTTESLAIMPQEWRSQLYQAATRVDNQEILQLLAEIPEEYKSLAQGLENLVDHFRCDKIIDLTKSLN